MASRDDAGIGIEPAHDLDDPDALLVRDVVGLVDDHDVGELDLLDQEVDQGPGILLPGRLAAVAWEVARVVILHQVHRVDHGHHGVEPRDIRQARAGLVAEVEGCCDGWSAPTRWPEWNVSGPWAFPPRVLGRRSRSGERSRPSG